MGSLVETIKDDARRRAVVDDCVMLLESEVASKGGFSGVAIKGGYKTVKKMRPGMIPMAMNHLLEDFAKQIDPIWADCGGDKAKFTGRKSDIANALLSITDERGRQSDQKLLVKVYSKLRPTAMQHIGDAVPRLADLIAKHAS
ncbi:MAG: hypothetical protein ACI8RZ_002686 [Myxococcota bacterium]|jgi:hypothetical protein